MFPPSTLLAPALLALLATVRADSSSNSTNSTALTGDKQCSQYMCVSAIVTEGSTTQYILSSTGVQTPGWMAVGFGTQMAGSSMCILWSNSDGSITLSQRKGTGEVLPLVDPNPSSVAVLSPNSSSVTGNIQFAFTIDTTGVSTQNIIYAFGDINPQSSAKDAQLQEHLDHETGVLDLTKPLSANGTVITSESSQTPLLPFQKLIIAHAILAVVAFLFVLPSGAILARYWRTFSHSWFKGHWILQWLCAGTLILASFICAILAVQQVSGSHFDDDHKKWGLALVILYVFQCSLGGLIHFVKPKIFKGRPPQNYFHAVVGLLIIALAMFQVHDGCHEEWPALSGLSPLANAVNIVFYIWIVLIIVVYSGGLVLLRRQFRQEAEGRRKKAAVESSQSVNYTAVST